MKLTLLLNYGSRTCGVSQKSLSFTWYPSQTGVLGNQISYRVMVARECNALERGNADFYDSGRITSRASISVPYCGRALDYAARYYIKIEAQYENTKELFYSDILPIITEMPPQGWSAVWISKPHPEPKNDFTYFRKQFRVKKAVKSAILYFSAHNVCKLWLNRKRVNADVSPAPSHIYQSKYYLAYDITDLVQQGENNLACILYYMNDSGQNYMDGLPGFLMQAFLEYEDGGTDLWVSDESWKVLEKTPYQSGLPCQQNRRISSVIQYDFNHEADHWLEDDYSDTHWEQAALSGINAQSWLLQPQFVPESTVHEKIVPTSLSVQKAGDQVFDVGKIISGWVGVDLKGISGAKVMIRYSEDLDEYGHVRHNVANESSDFYYDTCILREGNDLAFSADFSFKAFRYFEITGYLEMIQAENINAVSVGTDISFHSSFECSDTILNQIYRACIQTQTNNALNQLVDCPHREQAQYVADSDLQADTLIYNFNGYPLLKKVLDDFQHVQFSDGRFPFVFPTSFESEDFRLNIPEWDLYYASLLWKTYYFYGDENLLRRYFPTLQKVITSFLRRKDSKTGLVPRGFGWHISDWPYPHVDDENAQFLTVENCLLYFNLITAGKIARILEYEQDTVFYCEQARRLKEAINTCLYDPEAKLFFDGLPSTKKSQSVNTACYFYGVVPDQDKQALLNHIAAMPFDCSVVMTNKLLRILFEHGYEEAAYKILSSRTQPGWGYMMTLGYQTIWEGFSNIESHSHAWNAYPARIMQEYLCGIQQAAPGFQKIRIHPFLPEKLGFANASIATPFGAVGCAWEKSGSAVEFTIQIPANVSAVFELPDGFLLDGGRSVELTPGLHHFKL